MERNTSTPLPPWLGRTPVRSAKPGSILRARRSMRCHWGKLGRPSLGFSGPCISSHRTRVRKASQRFVSRNAFSTEETNQRFRQSKAKVPSSNQWIIAQPKSCLLIFPT